MGTAIRYSEEEGNALIERLARRRAAPPQTSISASPIEAPKVDMRRSKAKTGPSELELLFARQVMDAGLPPPHREYLFMQNRDFRLDYAWPEQMICVEVQGMVHRIRSRFLSDVEKLAFAQIHGWRLLLVAGQDVRSGRAMQWLTTLWAIYAKAAPCR